MNAPLTPLQSVRLAVEAKVRILFPEETFTPCPADGMAQDLSITGMRIVTTDIPEKFYQRLMQSVHFAKVTLQLPGRPDEITFHGRIAWMDFNNQVSPPRCTLGFVFENLGAEEIQALEESIKFALRRILEQ